MNRDEFISEIIGLFDEEDSSGVNLTIYSHDDGEETIKIEFVESMYQSSCTLNGNIEFMEDECLEDLLEDLYDALIKNGYVIVETNNLY